VSRGFCTRHYHDWYTHGDRGERRPKKRAPAKKCILIGCRENAVARGYCMMHYKRWSRKGSPD